MAQEVVLNESHASHALSWEWLNKDKGNKSHFSWEPTGRYFLKGKNVFSFPA